MSNYSSHAYGYGFVCKCSDEHLVNFIAKHKDAFCQSIEESYLFEKMYKTDLDDLFREYPCDQSSIEGKYAAISNIMSRETGVSFSFQPEQEDFDTPPTVMLLYSPPWEFNEVELKLTEESLRTLCKTYIEEIGIEHKPCYLCSEYVD